MLVAKLRLDDVRVKLREESRAFCLGMIAVCGIGSPSGCRNSAVTANQSAKPPTIDASAIAWR